jgi:hypothetical protein
VGFEREPDDHGVARFRWSKRKRKGAGPLETVTVAVIQVHRDRMTIDTNSRKRASATRRKVASALGGELPHLRRTESKPPFIQTDPVLWGSLRAEVSPGPHDVSPAGGSTSSRPTTGRWLDGPCRRWAAAPPGRR